MVISLRFVKRKFHREDTKNKKNQIHVGVFSGFVPSSVVIN